LILVARDDLRNARSVGSQ